jgi:hypothetical protein
MVRPPLRWCPGARHTGSVRPEPGQVLHFSEDPLRVLDALRPFWHEVIASTVGFSGIRLADSRPRA